MSYPNDLETIFVAKNGRQILFRPEKSDDTEMLWEMFSTLSEDSISNLITPINREKIESWTSNINYKLVLTIVGVVVDKEGVQHIVSSASLKFNNQEAFKHKAELGITVHDNYQNLGIGTALINYLLAIAKKMNLKKVHLHVNTKNRKAIELYKKAGFKIEGTLQKELQYKGKYFDVYEMAFFI